MWLIIVLLGIIILGLTHSKMGDLIGIAVIAYGFGMAYIREKKTWKEPKARRGDDEL